MFDVTRDPDLRRSLLAVRWQEGRFVTTENGQVLVLSIQEARNLVNALMVETMKIDLFAEEQEKDI